MKADGNTCVTSGLRFVGRAPDSSASRLQGAIIVMAAGIWVKSVFFFFLFSLILFALFCVYLLHQVQVLNVSLSVRRNGEQTGGESSGGLDRVKSFFLLFFFCFHLAGKRRERLSGGEKRGSRLRGLSEALERGSSDPLL